MLMLMLVLMLVIVIGLRIEGESWNAEYEANAQRPTSHAEHRIKNEGAWSVPRARRVCPMTDTADSSLANREQGSNAETLTAQNAALSVIGSRSPGRSALTTWIKHGAAAICAATMACILSFDRARDRFVHLELIIVRQFFARADVA